MMALTSPAFPVPCGPRASQRMLSLWDSSLRNCCLPHGVVGSPLAHVPITYICFLRLPVCLFNMQTNKKFRKAGPWMDPRAAGEPPTQHL